MTRSIRIAFKESRFFGVCGHVSGRGLRLVQGDRDMATERMTVDIAVVGAGSAGAATAYCLAHAGWRVALLDQQPFDRAGARWVNGVQPAAYDFAGIPRPEAPEMISRNFGFAIIPALSTHGFRLDTQPMWNVDMRLHVARLHRICREAGVQMFESVGIRSVDLKDGRPVALNCQYNSPSAGSATFSIAAKLFVDAAGMRGPIRSQVPELARHTPSVPSKHICTAMQEECEIADPESAGRFVARFGARPGDAIGIMSVDGGFSTFTYHIAADLSHVGCLAGSIADGKHATGPQLLARLKREQSWIGRGLFGGGGLIPLRRPYDRLTAPGIALVGDAACQVFPASGSGIALGMQAGKMLSDAVSTHDDPGCLEALWSYQSNFQRHIGIDLATFDLFRRFSQSLDADETTRLIHSGLMGAETFGAGLHQVFSSPSLSELPRAILGGIKEISLLRKAAPIGIKLPLVRTLYERYPSKPDMPALARWSKRVAAIFSEPADITST
jgi:flavin-dependent dehydrogenase